MLQNLLHVRAYLVSGAVLKIRFTLEFSGDTSTEHFEASFKSQVKYLKCLHTCNFMPFYVWGMYQNKVIICYLRIYNNNH